MRLWFLPRPAGRKCLSQLRQVARDVPTTIGKVSKHVLAVKRGSIAPRSCTYIIFGLVEFLMGFNILARGPFRCRTSHLLLVQVGILVDPYVFDFVLGTVFGDHVAEALGKAALFAVILGMTIPQGVVIDVRRQIIFFANAAGRALGGKAPLRGHGSVQQNVARLSGDFRTCEVHREVSFITTAVKAKLPSVERLTSAAVSNACSINSQD